MRDGLNKLFSFIVLAVVVLFLVTGGWRSVWRVVHGHGPELPAGLGPSNPQADGAGLDSIFNRMGVTSRGILTGPGGPVITLLWPQSSPNMGEAALNDAVLHRVIKGFRPATKPDVRNIDNRQMIVASYAIW